MDLAGHKSEQRTIEGETLEVDQTPPSVQSVAVASSNQNAHAAKEGDTITVRLKASEDIEPPVVTISGQPGIVVGHGAEYTAEHVVTVGDAQGPVSVGVEIVDVAGNTGAASNGTTDSSSVLIDVTPPTLSRVAITSSSRSGKVAGVGMEISVLISASEAIFIPTVEIAGAVAVVKAFQDSAGSRDYVATHTVTALDPAGEVAISVTAVDQIGNAAPAVAETTDGTAVTIDFTPPTFTAILLGASNPAAKLARAGDTLTLSLTASEDLNAPPAVLLAGEAATVTGANSTFTATAVLTAEATEGPASIAVSGFADEAGNAGLPAPATTDGGAVVVDLTLRPLAAVDVHSNNANPKMAKAGDVITVTFSGLEPMQTPNVTVGGHAAEVAGGGLEYTATYTVGAESHAGPAMVGVVFKDLAGNEGMEARRSLLSRPINPSSSLGCACLGCLEPSVTHGGFSI